MQIQYLVEQQYSEEPFYKDVYINLQKLGHNVQLLCCKYPIDDNTSNNLLHWMSKDADITLIDNSNALELLLNSSIDDSFFPNLISITESLIPLTTYCTPKPIIILNEGGDYLSDLNIAICVLLNQPRRYLDRTGHYQKTNYGWFLKNADEELFALGLWEKLGDNFFNVMKKNLVSWTNNSNIPNIKFKLGSMHGQLTVYSDGADQPIIISKKDFCEVAKCWMEYKKGLIPNRVLHNKTFLYPFILGLLQDWINWF